MATIGDLCKREVIVATTTMSVTDAAKLMRQHHVGTVVVLDNLNGGSRRPIGLVTDRDIVVEVVAREVPASALTVGDIMYRQLITVGEHEGVFETIQMMRHSGVRRLPVVGSDGRLIGIVAIDDLLGHVAEQLTGLTKVSTREQQYEASQRR